MTKENDVNPNDPQLDSLPNASSLIKQAMREQHPEAISALALLSMAINMDDLVSAMYDLVIDFNCVHDMLHKLFDLPNGPE